MYTGFQGSGPAVSGAGALSGRTQATASLYASVVTHSTSTCHKAPKYVVINFAASNPLTFKEMENEEAGLLVTWRQVTMSLLSDPLRGSRFLSHLIFLLLETLCTIS